MIIFYAQLTLTLAICFLPHIIKPKSKIKPEPPRTIEGKTYISDSNTYYYVRQMPKFALYALLNVVVFYILLLIVENCSWQDAIQISGISLIFCIVPFSAWGYKEVAITNSGLWVSNFSRSIEIPVNEIKEVSAYKLGVYITLKNRSSFGKSITFFPVDCVAIKNLLEQIGIEFKPWT